MISRRYIHALRCSFGAAAVCTALALALPAASSADGVPIKFFSATPSSTQAGGHPDISFDFAVENRSSSAALIDPCACKDARNLTVHLPTGLFANPHSTPQCNIAEFSSSGCPVDSQVGIAEIRVNISSGGGTSVGVFIAPVYNMIPPPDQAGLLAFRSAFIVTPVFTVASARTDSDYGVDATVTNIDHALPLRQVRQILWGIPADPIHDYLRWEFGQRSLLAAATDHEVLCDAEGVRATADPGTALRDCQNGVPTAVGDYHLGNVGGENTFVWHPVPSNSPLTPFWLNPTTCGTVLTAALDVLAYDNGTSHAESVYRPTTGCDQLTFNPSQAISPTTTAADSPSGAEFRLTAPQFESQFVPSPSELRAANVTLPAGFALAPNVINGKTVCSDAEARFGTTEEARCPENAKIGTLTVDTPVLPGPLPGAAYLGEPQPGNRFRLFLVFDGFGIHVKLAGTIAPDPVSGQIHIAFEDLPQAPFESFNMHIFGSERGPLATPVKCGTYPVTSLFTPWDSALPAQTSSQFFTIDQGPDGQPCPGTRRPFGPGFQAASAANSAAVHAAFSLNLTRRDGDQNLAALTVKTPPGFSATIKGVPYCPQAAIDQLAGPLHSGLVELASPVCPASRIGTVTAGVGAGTHPLYLPGQAYLAGPYHGAPLSLLVVIPAVSGPYDLGNVAVRAAIHVDPASAQITTTSDPLPQIVGGIPVRTRQILVNLDRPNFALNPTDCDPLSVDAVLGGDEGTQAALSSHFQVANCASLPFGPMLSLGFSGGVNRRGHPAIRAVLRTRPGEANPSAISVTLPSSELLDNAHIDTVCTRVAFAKQACPAGALLGHAEVTTPLLDQPLQGPAYLRSSGTGLPDLALDLGGQIRIEAVARIDAVNGGLRTTFRTVPDVPLGTVALDLFGGSKGLIQNSTGLCGAHKSAKLVMRGQNGKRLQRNVPLQAPSCTKAAKKHKRHLHRAREVR